MTAVNLPADRLTRLADRALGESRYIVARVQTADLATVEQDACMLAPVALDLLGVASGDQVVLEGAPDASGRVRVRRARALRAPDDMLTLRQQISGGEIRARFPSAKDALGVYPDLPWAFLDARTRQDLGLDKLHPVRIRAERGHQLRTELRELSLLVAIALLGVLTADIPGAVKAGTLGLLAAIISWVLRTRLQGRLSRTPHVLEPASLSGPQAQARQDHPGLL